MLQSFESRVVTKIDSLQKKEESSSSVTTGDYAMAIGGSSSTIEGGRWYHWKGAYRKVPID